LNIVLGGGNKRNENKAVTFILGVFLGVSQEITSNEAE
jgi:hypothetical protein